MLKNTLTISTAVALLTISTMADNTQRGHHNKNYEKSQQQKMHQHRSKTKKSKKERVSPEDSTNTTEENVSQLTESQQEALSFMVEEEKVAKDVYNYLSKKYNTKVFSNIAKSEQRHIDAVEKLLNSYGVTIPSTMDEEGIFIDEKLQTMYDDLIAKGDLSLKDAYEVGVEVEETDIDDLENFLADELPANIEKVYNNLLKGSYNHLRSFNRQLDK